jgi:hypothetical protein
VNDPNHEARFIWATFALVAVLVAVSGGVVFGGIFFSPVTDTTVKAMIEGRIISRAIVLFLIIPIIAILCVRERITGEAALAALSGIAGYILGGTQAQ